ncbi:MAG TPA: YdeI/OmpD-associated family protein [Candidatus Limnocylindrales bacterium]|nr:YdeI/OmpD-associated family protein [Candidatus Limnocylindrales bacterium]
MTSRPDPNEVVFFTTTAELREWFEANHQTADELWLGYHKKRTGRPTITWSDAVDEALCVGWIDSVRYSLDDDRSAQRFTPRRPRSVWSAINVRKVGELTAQGRMRPAGLAAFEARDPDRTAIYSHEQDEVALADDETALIRADDAAWGDWERRPPSYRRTVTHWIVSAKKPETRAGRLEALIEASAAGEPVGPMRAARPSR